MTETQGIKEQEREKPLAVQAMDRAQALEEARIAKCIKRRLQRITSKARRKVRGGKTTVTIRASYWLLRRDASTVKRIADQLLVQVGRPGIKFLHMKPTHTLSLNSCALVFVIGKD